MRWTHTAQVAAAKAALQSIDESVVKAILIQQTARLLLAKEVHKVRHLLEEGILQPKDADHIFHSIQEDYQRLDAAKYETYSENMQYTVHNRLSTLGMNGSDGNGVAMGHQPGNDRQSTINNDDGDADDNKL